MSGGACSSLLLVTDDAHGSWLTERMIAALLDPAMRLQHLKTSLGLLLGPGRGWAELKDVAEPRLGLVPTNTAVLDWETREIVARVSTPIARQFTIIPADVFQHFEIKDWFSGLAEAPNGERLYSIHMLPEGFDDGTRDKAEIGKKTRALLDGLIETFPEGPPETLGMKVMFAQVLETVKRRTRDSGFKADEKTFRRALAMYSKGMRTTAE